MATKKANYALESGDAKTIPAPQLHYEPPTPRKYNPPIGVIGCGGITQMHLRAYRQQS